jgi:hypothetical protein
MTDPIRSALAEMVRLRSAVDRRLDPAWADALDNARAALAAPVAQPQKDDIPTQAMCRAAVIYANGSDIYKRIPAEVAEIEEGIYAEVWKAMQAAAPVVAQPERRPDGMPTSPDERRLRRLLWSHITMAHTYYDDGEAAGQEHGISIDFMREPVADIGAKLRALNVARLECATLVVAQPTWVSVDTEMPASGRIVLVCYANSHDNLRRVRAKWVRAKTVESGSESDIGEYDEESDCYYDPEGWYECIDNWDDYNAVAISDPVTHWMPLPEPPDRSEP